MNDAVRGGGLLARDACKASRGLFGTTFVIGSCSAADEKYSFCVRSGPKLSFLGLLGLSTLSGCRLDNPGFDGSKDTSEIRDEESEEDETSDDEDASTGDDSEEAKSSTKSSEDSGSEKTSTSDDTSSATTDSSSETEKVDVKDVCNKGAGYCYDMKVVQDDLLDNMAPVNKDTGLQITAADSSASQDSPTFGHRLRLGSSSSAKMSRGVKVSAGSNFGVDIWYSPDFGSRDSMLLARIGDFMSIEIYKDKSAVCQIQAKDQTSGVAKSYSIRSNYFGTKSWQVISCSLRGETLELWNLDASVAYDPLKLAIDTDHELQVAIGEGATKSLDGIVHSSFVGDVHLMRVWTDVSGSDDVLRAELRSIGLEPPN